MDTSNLVVALIIFIARVCDVGLGTIRHVMIIRGRKPYAFLITFFEALIWVYAVSRVISTVQDPLTSLSFALGFASGTFVGMTVEGFLKIGEQVIRIFSNKGDLVAEHLREKGCLVTVFDGSGRDGVVKLLFVQVQRRKVSKVIGIARIADPSCFIILDDIRSVHVGNRSPEIGEELVPVAALATAENK